MWPPSTHREPACHSAEEETPGGSWARTWGTESAIFHSSPESSIPKLSLPCIFLKIPCLPRACGSSLGCQLLLYNLPHSPNLLQLPIPFNPSFSKSFLIHLLQPQSLVHEPFFQVSDSGAEVLAVLTLLRAAFLTLQWPCATCHTHVGSKSSLIHH